MSRWLKKGGGGTGEASVWPTSARESNMRPLHIVQIVLSALILVVMLSFGFLFGAGVLTIRCQHPTATIANDSNTAPASTAAPGDTHSSVVYQNRPGVKARLVCIRGLKINVTYPIFEGKNYIGRADELPVDIDLDDQEPIDRIWSSRQHALVTCADGKLILEDLNSANGTFVNRARLFPGKTRALQADDVIQVGTVPLKVQFQ